MVPDVARADRLGLRPLTVYAVAMPHSNTGVMTEPLPHPAAHDAELADRGWTLLEGVFDATAVAEMRNLLHGAFVAADGDESVRRRDAAVYAARNVIDVCPDVTSVWRTPALVSLVTRMLGPQCGLVRVLYFDKPPDQTWALPWHKDLMIAIADSQVPGGYSRPRLRAGVFHTEPPLEVLEGMLTLRIHLDNANADNGALEVLSGSHRSGKGTAVGFRREMVTAVPGDVLVMRPLLSHASGRSSPHTRSHRRILHLEFARSDVLPGRVRWNWFFHVG